MDIDPRLRDPGSSYPPLHHSSGLGAHAPIASNPPRLPPPVPYPSPHNGYPQPMYQAQTPQSTGHGGSTDQNSPHDTPDGAAGDPKRPRACEACRGLKVRCEFDPNNQDGPCKRCAKANRNCVVTMPSRKRQKKTDSRVAELEKKIDALTASLQASKSVPPAVPDAEANLNRSNSYEKVTSGSYNSPFDTERRMTGPTEWVERYPTVPERESKDPGPPPMVVAGLKRKFQDSKSNSPVAKSAPVSDVRRSGPPGQLPSGGTGMYPFDPAVGPKTEAPNDYEDVIDRGIISSEAATFMFDRYVKHMAPQMPAVIFPPGTTAAEIRKTKPTLFLAILGVGSGTDHPEIQRILTKEVMAIYGDRIICHGEKGLELIQALLVSTIWYWPPEHFEELKFYQLIHLGAVMGIDINIGKKQKMNRGTGHVAGLWRDHQWRRSAMPNPESIESRRTWLGCYFMCCIASMGLRRQNLIRWTNYMTECVNVLETSADAAPSDKFLCQWVRSQHIAEEIGVQFSMDDSFATVSIAETKVQYALKGFERDLAHWSEQVPPECRTSTLKMTEHVVNLYMHEVAMHVDHNVEEFKPPFTEENLRSAASERNALAPLTATHIAALSTCLTSIEGIFESFFALEIDVIRAIPVFNFVRIAYAVVVLIKMFFAAAIPNSELGKVIDKDNMKVEQYVDGLLEKFRAAAADDKSRPASKFLMVLVMLKTWFNRQKSGKGQKAEDGPAKTLMTGSSVPTPPDSGPRPGSQYTPQGLHNEYSPANTPLQLLSEVATTAQASRPESRNQYGTTQEWQPHQQPYVYPDTGYSNQAPLVSYGLAPMAYPNSNVDPALGVNPEFDFSQGEAGIGMILGDNEFGKYFSDDAFFGVMMESAGALPNNMFEGFS